MSFGLFYYTLFVLLVSILASATCLSAYLVSHKRALLFAFLAFLFYFFDVAWVFQDDTVVYAVGVELGGMYTVVRLFASVVTAAGLLVSFWLMVCDLLNEKRRALLVVPGVVFVLASTAMLTLFPEGDVQRFFFYSMRALMLFWILGFIAYYYYKTKEASERERLWRRRWLYACLWVLGIAVVVEDASFFLMPDPGPLMESLRAFAPERNYSENALMLLCAFVAGRDAVRTLALRFERPPMNGGAPQEQRINENLLMYARRHQLSAREQEVLSLVLLGKDNQNIASTMHLALSTVKVHVHNILQKTTQPDRQALTRDFWKMS